MYIVHSLFKNIIIIDIEFSIRNPLLKELKYFITFLYFVYIPRGFCRAVFSSSDALFNGTLNDLPRTATLLLSSMQRADKCHAACSDNLSVIDLWGPMPLSGWLNLHLFPYVHFFP